MKRTLILLLLLAPVLGFAQQENWTLHQEKNGVMIYKQSKIWKDASEGINQEMMLLKFVNSTDQALELEWYDVRWYDDNCVNCNHYQDPEYKHTLTLAPGETIEGKCSFDSPSGLSLFKRFIERESKSLTKFELRELIVNPS
ncbi:MAG: hypothetical protein K9H84_03370 [Bacteroidales bacterium]|nr:hypothetical protein [Bacteroidales bacterium]